jgi:hypothetical protein
MNIERPMKNKHPRPKIDDLVRSRHPVEKRGPGVCTFLGTLDSGFRRNPVISECSGCRNKSGMTNSDFLQRRQDSKAISVSFQPFSSSLTIQHSMLDVRSSFFSVAFHRTEIIKCSQ